MQIFDRLLRRSKTRSAPAPNRPTATALHELLEAAQRAKRAEQYPQALDALNRGLALAANDATSVAIITVTQAEVYIRQRAWDEAETTLRLAQQVANDASQRIHLAYVLDMQGVLALARGDWELARDYYEQALETARGVRAIGAEGRALGHLADVYLNDDNASYAIHLLREALPKLNMAGDIEHSVACAGCLGQTLIQIGQEAEGRQLIDRALRLARQIGDRGAERRWSVVSGQQALHEGRYDEASDHLRRALLLFDGLSTPEHIQALCQGSQASLGLHQIPQSVEYARQAVELAGQLEDESVKAWVQAQAHGTLGAALLADQGHADAIEHLRIAADLHTRLDGRREAQAEIDVLRSLGAALSETGQDAQAVDTYRQALRRAEHLETSLPRAQAHRDLGLLYARRFDMHSAIREWSAALAIYEADKFPAQVARLYCDIAAARKYLGQGQRALKDYEQALMAINDLKEDWETRGLVLSNAANIYVDQGDIESAEAFFNESIAIARRLGNQTAEAIRRGNYGWFLLATGRPQQAIAALQYALQVSKSLRLDLQAAIQTDNLGLAQDALGNYPRALEYHQQALEAVEPLNNRHWQNVFQANLAATLTALGRVEEAVPLLAAALAGGRAAQDVEVIVRALIGQGRIALRQGQPEQAGPLLEEAVSSARKADMRRLQAEALSLHSEQQAALNQADSARVLWEEARRLFGVLHMPHAKMYPVWLGRRVEPSSQR